MGTKARQSTHAVARETAATVRAQVFRMLARERGGVTARTRAGIEAEANMAANHAAQQVYIAAGYKQCLGTSEAGLQCDRLCSPGFRFCPACAGSRVNAPSLSKAVVAYAEEFAAKNLPNFGQMDCDGCGEMVTLHTNPRDLVIVLCAKCNKGVAIA